MSYIIYKQTKTDTIKITDPGSADNYSSPVSHIIEGFILSNIPFVVYNICDNNFKKNNICTYYPMTKSLFFADGTSHNKLRFKIVFANEIKVLPIALLYSEKDVLGELDEYYKIFTDETYLSVIGQFIELKEELKPSIETKSIYMKTF